MGVHSFLVAAIMASLAVAAPFKKDESVRQQKVANFPFYGVNEAGPEFGEKKFPGQKGKEYVWPTLTSIDTFHAKGMNTFRINILAERLIPDKQTGTINSAYLKDLKDTVNHITKKGDWAMIVPHNYGRWYGQVITDVTGFEAYWKTLAREFKDDEKVVFDTNNEFHDMDQNLVVRLNQAAINGIRAVGATTQWINVEGNSWSGAWTWVSKSQNGATMANLKDPSNKIMYQMHQYLDFDGSGTHAECVSRTIGVERLREATAWLRQHHKVGIIGEFAGGNNEQCKAGIKNMLDYMVQNKDVWKGALWWSAGPWWADYMFSLEPGSGKAYGPYLDLLMQYA